MLDFLFFLSNKYRFSAWLIFFLVLLLFIPLLISLNHTLIAKTLGILIIIFVSAALWNWREQTLHKILKASRIKLNLNDRFWLNRNVSFYEKLNKYDKIIFEDRIGLFLAEIIITELGKEVPEKETCFYVASSAIIAFWGLPYWNYGDLDEVIVYSDNLKVENEIDKNIFFDGKLYHDDINHKTIIISLTALKNDISLVWFSLLNGEIHKINNNHSVIDSKDGSSYSDFFLIIMGYYKENPFNFEMKHPKLFQFLKSKI